MEPEEDTVVEIEEVSASEAAKIAAFESENEIPQWCQDTFDWMDEDAKYLSEECIYAAMDDEHSTSTNYILRNQFVLISQIYARNPTARIQPTVMMGGQPPGLMEFAKTLEIISKRLTDEAGFRQKLGGAIQDVQTYGVSWLKVTAQEDITRDPIGAARQNDQLDNIARLKALMQRYQDSEFDEDSECYQDLLDLSDTVKSFIAGNIREDLARNPPKPVQQFDEMGQPTLVPDPNDPRIAQLTDLDGPDGLQSPGALPEVPIYLGINIDEVQPQDMRFDWSITRPEDFYEAAWVSHRVYMTPEDAEMRWGVDAVEVKKHAALTSARATKKGTAGEQDPSNRGKTDEKTINDRIAVWERWDKNSNRRYVWIEGMSEFLVNEVARNTWHKFFPFFPMVFNRVTGRFLPMSDVRLQRPLQEEINTKRTHEREAQAAAYPRYVVGAGSLEEEEKEKLENARPFAVIELSRPEEVMKYFKDIAGGSYDPALYDTSNAIREIEISAGIPQQAAGGVGNAEFATEAAIANQQMGVQADRRKTIIEELIHDVNECTIEMALQLLPEENARALAGPGAVWPLVDREHLWRQLNVIIEPGMSGKPDQDKVLNKWMNFADVMNRLGLVVNPMEVAKKILDELDLGIDPQRFIIDPSAIPQPGGPAGTVPGGNPDGVPAGKTAGAPPMPDRQGPPQPSQVPNAPTGAVQ